MRKLSPIRNRPRVIILEGLLVAGLLVVMGILIRNSHFWVQVLTLALLLGVVAQSWNLVAGYVGQFSLAQTAFFGIGAYVGGICEIKLGVPLLVGVVIGAAAAGVVGLMIGLLTVRLGGHYFALVSFLIVIALGQLTISMSSLTGGGYGLSVPLGSSNSIVQLRFTSPEAYFWVTAILAVISTVVIRTFVSGRIGLFLRAVRDDETAASSLGVESFRMKVLAMVVSAVIAGMVGPVYLATYNLIDPPSAFGVTAIVGPVVGGMLGGVGIVVGGLLGQGILQPITSLSSNYFANARFDFAQLIYGLLVLVVVLVLPDGIGGRFGVMFAKLRVRYYRKNREVPLEASLSETAVGAQQVSENGLK